MTEIAIQVQEISKRYRIGVKDEMHDTFAGAMGDWFRRPVKNLRRLRRLSRFTDEESEDVIWALRDVSFQVKPGEVVGVIGRNGAGKSTLLKILSRITHPTSGRVELNGRVSSLLEVGTGFHPELTGRENIYLNGTILGMTRREIDRKFDEIIDFSGVEKFIDTPVKRYSSGMRVRLAFSVAAHLEPEILLVDEVLSVGDAEFQRKSMGKMGEVAGEGRTVLFVSHNMSAIQYFCNRGLILHNGRIEYDYERIDLATQKYLSLFNDAVQNGFKRLDVQENHHNEGNYLTIASIQLLGSNGNQAAILRYGEPFGFALEVNAYQDISNFSVVVGIDTMERMRIATFTSHESERFYSLQAFTTEFIKLKISDLKLTPGDYQISVALRVGKTSIVTLMYVFQFSVSEVTYRAQRPHDGTWGYVKANAEWF